MRRMSKATIKLLVAYVCVLVLIFALFGYWIFAIRETMIESLLNFVLPDSWVGAAKFFVMRLLEQHPGVLKNLILNVILIVIPLLTFWLKELLSASYEQDLNANDPDWHKPGSESLKRQFLDELIFFAVLMGFSLLSLRVTLIPGWSTVGKVFMMITTMVTFVLDYLAPTLSRHHHRPTDVFRLLFVDRWTSSLVFGIFMSGTLVLMPYMTSEHSVVTSLIIAGALTPAYMVIAVFFGTWFGTMIVNSPSTPKRSNFGSLFLCTTMGLLLFNGIFFVKLGRDFYHLSPVLKCEWEIVPNSLDFVRPQWGNPTAHISFDVDVTNPTSRTAAVGDNQIRVLHRGDTIVHTSVPEFSVSAGQTVRQHIGFEMKLNGRGVATKGVRLVGSMIKQGVKTTLQNAAQNVVDPKQYSFWITIPTPTGDFEFEIKPTTNNKN